MPAELAGQLAAVRAQRALTRKQRWRGSRLDRYRAELMALAALGASWRDLALWLRQYKRVKVDPSTVGRRLACWARTPVSNAGAPGSG